MAPSSSQSVTAALHFDKGDSVTLIVGPEKRELLVHANYIARNSAFFKTALKKEWREGQTRTINLPTYDYETMTSYLKFVYGIQLSVEVESDQLRTCREPTADQLKNLQAAYLSFAKLYVLGCRLMDNTFKDAAITRIFKLFQTYNTWSTADSLFSPGPVSVNTIYDETLESDPARRLMVDMYMLHPQDLSSEYDAGFLLDLAQGLSKSVREGLMPAYKTFEVHNYLS
jgi:hypothetical protein